MSEVRELPVTREVITEVRELVNTEFEAVSGESFDFGNIVAQLNNATQVTLGFVCFFVGAVFCIDAIVSHDPWSIGIGFTLLWVGFLLVRGKLAKWRIF